MFGRHLHWFTQSPDGKLWSPPEGEGGDGDWPAYDVPDLGGQPPAPPATPPAAGALPADGTGDRGDGQPGVRQPPQQQPGQPGQPRQQQTRTDLPPYRQQQISARDAAAEEDRISKLVNDRIQQTLANAFGLGPKGATGAPEDPRAAAVRDKLFAIVPGLKELLEKQKEILGAAESGGQWTETNKVYWQGVAARTVSDLHNGAATLLLGTGKAAKDLDADTRADVHNLFTRWVESDKTGARVMRYESQDQNLVKEFLTAFGARYVDPVRRAAAAGVQQRGAARAAVPSQGAGAMPPAARPPAQDNQDEDAVHGRAWAIVQNLKGLTA